ncbi:Transmembrane protein 106B [Larimichthys crocea]|uniref:Uncharacterized protein n=1 Tax=Larimichthys crocea TaxID=215358 RepID=A0ACD3RRI8_LARCR|nr:Transmembrane protein 106B [Larimichthys crocea]
MVTPGRNIKPAEGLTGGEEGAKTLRQFPPYGSMNRHSSGDSCPTCRGTGRIPRGQEDQLVAVIPCNDVRLKPRRTKLTVCVSMGLCLFVCCLILFFLFPRSVTLTPVSVQSVMVYFSPNKVQMEVTFLLQVEHYQDSHSVSGAANDDEHILPLSRGAGVSGHLRIRRLWQEFDDPASCEMMKSKRKTESVKR